MSAQWFGTDKSTPPGIQVDEGLANVNFALREGVAQLIGGSDLQATSVVYKWARAVLEGGSTLRALGRTDCTTEIDLPLVDWSPYFVDLCAQARERLLYQFRNSPVLVQIVCQLNQQIQEAYEVTLDVMRKCEISTAQGVQLDVIGRRVGCTRLPSSMSDDAYRYKIVAKIFKNHVLYCSVTEVQHYFAVSQQRGMSAVTVGPMEVDLYVSSCVGLTLLLDLIGGTDTPQADWITSTPWAATLNIHQIIVVPPGKAFIPDKGNGYQVDAGLAAVTSGII